MNEIFLRNFSYLIIAFFAGRLLPDAISRHPRNAEALSNILAPLFGMNNTNKLGKRRKQKIYGIY